MQRALVLDKNKNPLMPCHPARARQLLKTGKAAVFRRYPFTIIMKEREGGAVQNIQLKLDPGSKHTGIALVMDGKHRLKLIWAGVINHRGEHIKMLLLERAGYRRRRRTANIRRRRARFSNRTGKRKQNRLAPSVASRVHNTQTWVNRLGRSAPVTHFAIENVKFDTQLMQNPEVSGIEYQRGTLYGYQVKEYLLSVYEHKCVYCEAKKSKKDKHKDPILEIEHIIPVSRGGSNRISNLTIACSTCNRRKGNKTAAEFGYPEIQAGVKPSLADATKTTSIRTFITNILCEYGLPMELGDSAMTKYNRSKQSYPKDHWIDAVCVGYTGRNVFIHPRHQPLIMSAQRRQSRKMRENDGYGFPRRKKDGSIVKPKGSRRRNGFETGDIVFGIQPQTGRRVTGKATLSANSLQVKTPSGVYGVSPKYAKVLHRADGYNYAIGTPATFPTS